jgi:hypothetical protein
MTDNALRHSVLCSYHPHMIDSGLVRSHVERRCSILGPTQSRISPSILLYKKITVKSYGIDKRSRAGREESRRRERIFTESMTSDRKLKASREGSK